MFIYEGVTALINKFSGKLPIYFFRQTRQFMV